MKCFTGIDLGSTTTKAIILDEAGEIVGRGITNSRSNYEVAARVAKEEAFINARFFLLKSEAAAAGLLDATGERFLADLGRAFRYQRHLSQLQALKRACFEELEHPRYRDHRRELEAILDDNFAAMEIEAGRLFAPGTRPKSDFFRDLAGSQYLALAERKSKEAGLPFETLMGVYDKSILIVENQVEDGHFEKDIEKAFEHLAAQGAGNGRLRPFFPLIKKVATTPLEEVNMVGTGYGRQRLPFPKESIRSEILCHGLGAHTMFPNTATVLDIGGQDTKAIQVDPNGIVVSFQMNDRCAAGCGRYLGYIADEMNLGLHELGPMALKSTCGVKINSTCTVFAGAELRDRLALGQKREDILAGLHRAIILRAMSLLARSGGIRNEFTFTGGVAKNPAAVKALKELVRENYGDVTINIHPDSIFTGALGAALFARQAVLEQN